jgi:dethiobiotin synthetase
MSRALFIAGAHTDIGKTYVACALIRATRAAGLTVAALKPVVSGFNPGDWGTSDPGRLLAALGRDLTPEALAEISPRQYAAPLAPPMAARLEGETLRLADLAEPARAWLARTGADLALVEGAGGVMSPLAEDGTNLDLMQALGLPSVLVGGGYLGTISHTLTALEVLRARGIPPLAIVVSASADPEAPDFAETAESIRAFAGGLAVIAAPRGGGETWAGELLAAVSAKA